MTTPRDEIWIDMIQFDTSLADAVWDGVTPLPGAPPWYDNMTTLVDTARGPAEPGELIAEPLVVEKMHRTTLRPGRVAVRRRPGRALGRVLAMKAAAATTASVVGVAAAAAATTGLVATVATVVVPVLEERVVAGLGLSDEESATVSASGRSLEGSSSRTEGELACTVSSAVYGGFCVIDPTPAAGGSTADAPVEATAEPAPAGIPSPRDIAVEPEAAPVAVVPDVSALDVTDPAPAESPAPEALPEATPPPTDRPAARTPPKDPGGDPSPTTVPA
ncbi:MAG TPA: hypothetical protein VJM75_04340, partial [Acidimicrobiales bacterium]|nr:hypothetical protein [Acidimicrobiales bacterium]